MGRSGRPGAKIMLGQVILDKYKVLRQLDEGGMSKIYLARQLDAARDVVVKVLKEPLRAQAKTVEHFRREIYITSRFHHPHAVACFDSATKGPHGPVLVMELLRGLDMNALLMREGRFTPERTGRLLVQLCDVLQAAHEAGIVHRDLKPGNVFVLHPNTPHETVKLMDFGLAKMTTMLYISPDELFDFRLPPASGTPEYISPEMVRGIELDGRGDLYSVGVMLFEMLTGRRPFQHPTVEGLMLAHASEAPPRFSSVGRGAVPAAVETVVRSCMAKHPDQRPAKAWDLALEFEKALGRRLISGRAQSPSSSGAMPVLTAAAAASSAEPVTAADRHAVRLSVEASMPDVMAIMKLKGFVADLGGEVLESVPGLIKVRLVERAAEEKKSSGLFGWARGGSASKAVSTLTARATDLDLYMERRDPAQPNRLTITLVMRPAGGLASAEWRTRCQKIGRDLQAYLMGR